MLRSLGIIAGALFAAIGTGVPTAVAQNSDYCTAVCGGRAGGESANPPEVVACYRKCMGQKPKAK